MNRRSTEISIIIATYNRPDALSVAVQSVLYQTFPHWKLYVIGDCCDERTQTVMAPFEEDSKVFYINLSSRTGSQALPNSVGMNLSNTPYIAFLNHDDIWLPDHLEIALEHLKEGTSDFFLGSSIVISGIEGEAEGLKAIIRMRTGHRRKLEDCFNNYHIFEPASSWVIHKKLAQKTGPWNSPYNIYRFPSQDWVLRAWRSGAKLSTDPRYTSLKMETHLKNRDQKNLYSSSADIHTVIFDYCKNHVSDDIRENLIYEPPNEHKNPQQRGTKKERTLASVRKSILKLKIFSWMYYTFGIDIDTWLNKLYGRKTGSNWIQLLKRRTEENSVDPPDLTRLTLEAKSLLSLKEERT